MEQCGYDTGVPDVSTWVSGSISDMDGDTVTDALIHGRMGRIR